MSSELWIECPDAEVILQPGFLSAHDRTLFSASHEARVFVGVVAHQRHVLGNRLPNLNVALIASNEGVNLLASSRSDLGVASGLNGEARELS